LRVKAMVVAKVTSTIGFVSDQAMKCKAWVIASKPVVLVQKVTGTLVAELRRFKSGIADKVSNTRRVVSDKATEYKGLTFTAIQVQTLSITKKLEPATKFASSTMQALSARFHLVASGVRNYMVATVEFVSRKVHLVAACVLGSERVDYVIERVAKYLPVRVNATKAKSE